MIARRLIVLTAALVALAVLAVMLQGPLGLVVRVSSASGSVPAAAPRVDLAPSSDSVEARRTAAGLSRIHVRWDGLIGWPSGDPLVLRLRARGAATVAIDGDPVLRLTGPDLGQATATISRSAGPHATAIDYDPADGPALIDLAWNASAANEFRGIQPEAFSPESISRHVWPWRRVATALFAIAGSACGVLLIFLLARECARWLPPSDVLRRRDVRVMLACVAVVCAIGVWWGWPDGEWAADELTPSIVLDALTQHLAHGWADKYPPMHYYLLSIVYLPLLLAQRVRQTLTDSALQSTLFLAGRVLSVLMAVTTIALVARLADRVLGPRFAWPAGFVAAAALPFAFYAKTANVDVPSLFWSALSLVFLAEVYSTRRTSAIVGFAISAAFATGTKDPAYAMYVLPVIHLTWTLGRTRSGWRLLAIGGIAGIVALLLAFNIVFNPSGFIEHAHIVRGPASAGYRMFPPSPLGEWQLALTTASLLMWTLGVPGIIVVLIGIGVLWRGSIGVRLPIWIWLAIVSYYLAFLAIAGYVYDRFLLQLTLLLALVGAAGLRWILDRAPLGRARQTVAVAIVGWLAWRSGSIDLLMIRDSRPNAEAWLREHVQLGDLVVTISQSGYGARLKEFAGIEILPSEGATMSANPDFIVINTEYTQRFRPGSAEYAWQEWLDRGEGPYACVYRHRTSLAGTAFAWSARMTDNREDAFTNLDKINPEIAIYARKK